jgi:hypothetical protein
MTIVLDESAVRREGVVLTRDELLEGYGRGFVSEVSLIRLPTDAVSCGEDDSILQSVQTVTATWPHTDTVVTLTLADGSVVETTASHPWWVESERAYIRTDHLAEGDELLTADGATITVADWPSYTESSAWGIELSSASIR